MEGGGLSKGLVLVLNTTCGGTEDTSISLAHRL